MNQATHRPTVKTMESEADDPVFVRHGASSSRWSFGRCSMRSLATLLKRGDGGVGSGSGGGGGKQKQNQLASLDNDVTLGNNCIGDLMKRRKKSAEKQQLAEPCAAAAAAADSMPNAGRTLTKPAAVAPRIRTTVLGCPRKLRASLRSPQPLSQLANEQPKHPACATSASITASPVFLVKGRQSRIHVSNRIPDYSEEYNNDRTGADSDSPAVTSLLLELNGEMRRIALVGWAQQLHSLSDILSLFASHWPAEVQAMAGNWRVSLLKPGSPVAGLGWETLCSDAQLASCGLPHGSRLRLERNSCSSCCTCCLSSSPSSSCSGGRDSRDSQLRIDRLEERVTLLARRLTVQQDQQPVGKTEAGRLEVDDDTASGPIQGHQQRAQRLRDLRNECRELRQTQDALRREHDTRVRETRRMMTDFAGDVRRILGAVADSKAAVTTNEEEGDPASSATATERRLVQAELQAYQTEGTLVSAMIQDIDETAGELRHDVLHRRCRSNPAEVELLALHLSRATQRLACLKNRFPGVQTRTRDLLRQEALAAQADERLLTDEEARLDVWLRKVKKLTMMLYTFKQLADAQAREAPSFACAAAVQQCAAEETTAEARRDVLRGVLSVYPDHERRAKAIELAEVGIERRRRMLREVAALKAEKTLTTAASRLKPVPTRQALRVGQHQQQQDAMVVRVGEFGADSNL